MSKACFRLTLLFAVIAALTATPQAFSDKIYLKSGKVVEGKILEETDEGVRLGKSLGEIVYLWSEIERIEKTSDMVKVEYEALLEETDKEDAESVASLARWCEEKGLKKEARTHWDEVIEIDPDHEEAREARGFVRTEDGRWVTGAEARRLKREKKEKEKADERAEEKKEEYTGVPWDAAEPVETAHYSITCNASPEVAERYASVMESAYDAFFEFFKRIHQPSGEKSEVYIVRNYDDFLQLTQRPGIAGFYTPMGSPNIPARTVVAYHGGFGATGSTDEVLLHEATHQFEHLVIGENFWNAPIWIVEGLAVFFEASRIEKGKVIYKEKGSSDVGIIPRERLLPLQDWIRQGKHVPVKSLLRVPQPMYSGFFYPHGWSLVYWMWNADGGKYRTIFDQVWKTARERRVTPEEVEEKIKDATGHDIKEFEEKVWKPYVLSLKPPPTGIVRRNKFTSDRMRVEIKGPGRAWKWVEKDLAVWIQVRLKNEKADATIELRALMARISMEDLREKGLDGLFEEDVETRRNAILDEIGYDEEVLKEEELRISGLRAMRFEYTTEADITDEEEEEGEEEEGDEDGEEEDDDVEESVTDDEEEEDEPLLKLVLITRTVERSYEIYAQCPAKHADRVRKDFDRVVRSLKILP